MGNQQLHVDTTGYSIQTCCYTVLQFLLKSLCSFLTIKEQLKADMFITVKYAVVKRKPEKSQACRDSNPDLYNTGAVL